MVLVEEKETLRESRSGPRRKRSRKRVEKKRTWIGGAGVSWMIWSSLCLLFQARGYPWIPGLLIKK